MNITSSSSDFYLVEGGKRLKGSVRVSGSKNASLPIIFATLLTSESCTIQEAPNLLDVRNALSLLEYLGAESYRVGENLYIKAERLKSHETPHHIVRKMRASILSMGPLLVRFGEAVVAMPGGCSIGLRPVDQHIKLFERAGARVSIKHGYIHLKADKLKPIEFDFDLVTVTGTENALLLLSAVEGRSILRNVAIEPEVLDLIEVLRKMGAEIELWDRTIEIRGTPNLTGFSHRVIPDRIEAGTFMVASLITGGDIVLENIRLEHLGSVCGKLEECGGVIEKIGSNRVRVYRKGAYIHPTNIQTQEYPGFPTDMQAQFMSLLSLANGVSEITENIFENRFQHVAELSRMGADIKIHGRTAVVRGVEKISGAEVFSTDLRASAGLVLAGLVAEGRTTIRDIYHLDRGYEFIDKKLRKLGASIERLTEHED